jgi:hypothetical protein
VQPDLAPAKERAMNKRDSAPRRKLILNKATLRHLTSTELGGVAGGARNPSVVTNCDQEEPCGPTWVCSQQCTGDCSILWC